MTVIVIAVLFLIAATRTSKPAPGGMAVPSGDSGAQRWSPRVAGAVSSDRSSVVPGGLRELGSRVNDPASRASGTARYRIGTCRSARNGLRWYRGRYLSHRAKMGAGATLGSALKRASSCPRTRYLAARWRTKAYAARVTYERWAAVHVLRDPEVRPGNDAWEKAVQRVQRVFPGTASWLISCSWAEGKWGRWVVHGGGDYYPGAEYAKGGKEVGGWMQYTYGTFKGHFRHGLEALRSRGFRVPPHLRDPGNVRAWRSALGQALAGGWARWAGEDDSHWSASWEAGCR